MQLAISNIAWRSPRGRTSRGAAEEIPIDTIDVAPGKYFPNPLAAHSTEIARVRDWWAQRGIAINGMQDYCLARQA